MFLNVAVKIHAGDWSDLTVHTTPAGKLMENKILVTSERCVAGFSKLDKLFGINIFTAGPTQVGLQSTRTSSKLSI